MATQRGEGQPSTQEALKPIDGAPTRADMLASYSDMICSGEYDKGVGINVFIPERHRSSSREAHAEFLLSTVAPWYVSFYATWREYVYLGFSIIILNSLIGGMLFCRVEEQSPRFVAAAEN